LLHIINNVCAQALSQISSNSGSNIENIINVGIVSVGVIILIVAFIKKRNNIRTWLGNNKIETGIVLSFFTSISIILVVFIDILCVISGIGRV
jgi:hypothetical protein